MSTNIIRRLLVTRKSASLASVALSGVSELVSAILVVVKVITRIEWRMRINRKK